MDQTGMNEDRVDDDLRARMSEADAAQWDEIQQWKASQLSYKRPHAITEKMKSAALAPVSKAVSIARKVPGGEALTRTVSSAALGLVELAASASEASVRRKRILKAYRAAGHDVNTLQDIRALSLDQVLAVKPRLSLAYSGTAAAEGAVSGVFASGGSVAAVLGMGVGTRRGCHGLGDGRRCDGLPCRGHAPRRPHGRLLRLRLRGSHRATLLHDGPLPSD